MRARPPRPLVPRLSILEGKLRSSRLSLFAVQTHSLVRPAAYFSSGAANVAENRRPSSPKWLLWAGALGAGTFLYHRFNQEDNKLMCASLEGNQHQQHHNLPQPQQRSLPRRSEYANLSLEEIIERAKQTAVPASRYFGLKKGICQEDIEAHTKDWTSYEAVVDDTQELHFSLPPQMERVDITSSIGKMLMPGLQGTLIAAFALPHPAGGKHNPKALPSLLCLSMATSSATDHLAQQKIFQKYIDELSQKEKLQILAQRKWKGAEGRFTIYSATDTDKKAYVRTRALCFSGDFFLDVLFLTPSHEEKRHHNDVKRIFKWFLLSLQLKEPSTTETAWGWTDEEDEEEDEEDDEDEDEEEE
ncbi:hypothetical protein QOT17_008908 [Balamuthia mandrillaris]